MTQLKNYGVVVKVGSMEGLLEEAPDAYKDVNNIVNVVHKAGNSRKVAKMKPIAIIEG